MSHRVLVELSIEVRLRATPRVGDAELEEGLLARGLDVNASLVAVLSLRADDAFERLREGQVDVHMVLAAHDLQRCDAGHSLGSVQRPQFVAAAHLCYFLEEEEEETEKNEQGIWVRIQNPRNNATELGDFNSRGLCR